MAEFSPLMQQYFGIKEQYKDAILFFRVGDFYEMFFDDAILASRELEIAKHVCEGKTNKEIAEVLFISQNTVRNHIYNIYKKVGVKNKIELINKFQ